MTNESGNCDMKATYLIVCAALEARVIKGGSCRLDRVYRHTRCL